MPLVHVRIFQPIAVPRQLLWSYLSTAPGLACWQADEVQGSLADGEFSLRWPTFGARMDLSVRSVVPEEALVLSAGQNTVRLSLTADGVELLHSGLEEDDELDGLRCSWRLALSLLAHAATTSPGQRRSVSWSFQASSANANLISYYLMSELGLRQWLGKSDGDLREGCPYELRLSQTTLRGKVVVGEEGRDIALTIQSPNDAFLVLRTLPAPMDGRVIALGVNWFGPHASPDYTAELQGCLERLAALKSPAGN